MGIYTEFTKENYNRILNEKIRFKRKENSNEKTIYKN